MAVFFQQIRFAFKNLKRYILEKDIKYLSHWDIVSVFVDSVTKGLQSRVSDDVGNQISDEYIERKLRERQE